jgi:GT2 family glycosyltransferase
MSAATTIVVAPRERFRSILPSLRSLFATIPRETPVIVVEGCSPDAVRAGLRALQDEHPFTWIARDHFITPHEARNIGFAQVTSAFVVFADNDMIYEPGWLACLEDNARRNDSDMVAPAICIGPPRATTVHHAGGTLVIDGTPERPHVTERHRMKDEPLAALREEPLPQHNDVVEFHCFLARSAFIAEQGPLDERLITREQVDIALRAALAGARVTFEAGAVVTYDARMPFERDDLMYHLFRWSHELAQRSLDVFRATWGIETDASRVLNGWIAGHRLRAITSAYPDEAAAMGPDRFRTEFAAPLEARLTAQAMATRRNLPPQRYPRALTREARTAFFARHLKPAPSPPALRLSNTQGRTGPMIVAGMATMRSRHATFSEALASILPQVDRLFLFLDGLERAAIVHHPKIVPLHSHIQGELGAGGKLLGLTMCNPGDLYLTVDDDIRYPADYVARMRSHLEATRGQAVFGVHGSVLKPNLASYLLDRQVAQRSHGRERPSRVDILGTDGAIFSTARLSFDVRDWEHRNMVDLQFARECAERGIQRFTVARPSGWLEELEIDQPDSIARALNADDSVQTRLAQDFLRRFGGIAAQRRRSAASA